MCVCVRARVHARVSTSMGDQLELFRYGLCKVAYLCCYCNTPPPAMTRVYFRRPFRSCSHPLSASWPATSQATFSISSLRAVDDSCRLHPCIFDRLIQSRVLGVYCSFSFASFCSFSFFPCVLRANVWVWLSSLHRRSQVATHVDLRLDRNSMFSRHVQMMLSSCSCSAACTSRWMTRCWCSDRCGSASCSAVDHWHANSLLGGVNLGYSAVSITCIRQELPVPGTWVMFHNQSEHEVFTAWGRHTCDRHTRKKAHAHIHTCARAHAYAQKDPRIISSKRS
jgi:hypothetical protein